MSAFCLTLFTLERIAYIECHDAQGAANLKAWFDNKSVLFYTGFTVTLNHFQNIVISKIVERPLPSRTQPKEILSALSQKVCLSLNPRSMILITVTLK